MLLSQAILFLIGAIVALVGRILRREKIATVGVVLMFIGAFALIYSILAVVF